MDDALSKVRLSDGLLTLGSLIMLHIFFTFFIFYILELRFRLSEPKLVKPAYYSMTTVAQYFGVVVGYKTTKKLVI